MKETTQKLLEKASRAIHTSERSLQKRISADYGVEADLASEDVTTMIGQAQEFLSAAHQYLGSQA